MPGLEEVVAAREAAEEVCRLLIGPSPDVLDASRALLSRAVVCLQTAGPIRSDGAVCQEAIRFRMVLRRAAALLRSAAGYHTGWNSCLQARTGGYQAGGIPARIARQGVVYVRG